MRSTTGTSWSLDTSGRSASTSKSSPSITTSRSSRPSPGGLPGATALAQAKARGAFTASHQSYWYAARHARGDSAGTRALIEILLAHRTMTAAALTAAMGRAVASGCLDPQLVLIDARGGTNHVVPVVPIGALVRYDRPPPSLSDYDDLLTGSRT